jgi:hypothetical protein
VECQARTIIKEGNKLTTHPNFRNADDLLKEQLQQLSNLISVCGALFLSSPEDFSEIRSRHLAAQSARVGESTLQGNCSASEPGS